MNVGDIVYIVESHRFIREAQIIHISGELYRIRFKDSGGAIQIRKSRLFLSEEAAQASVHQAIDPKSTTKTMPTEHKPHYISPYDVGA